MNAHRLPELLLQCLAALRSAFRQPPRPAHASTREPASVFVAQPPAPVELAVTEDFADAATEPAVRPRLRTLEEVRADLATLRERTRAQQSQAQARRDMSFAPTDFMDFADANATSADRPASGFAPTDFMDFEMPRLQPGR